MDEEPRKNSDKTPYEVGYGKPPKATQFQKGRSGNPSGRPKNFDRLLLPLQRIQDVLQALERPVEVAGKKMPYNVLNLELLKKKAIGGNGPNQRYLDKLHQEMLNAVAQREGKIERHVDKYYELLKQGDPPKFVAGTLNDCALELNQVYKDQNKSAADARRRAKRARDRKVVEIEARLDELRRADEEDERQRREADAAWTSSDDRS